MRTVRRRDALGVVCSGAGPSLRVRARTPPVQRPLRGGCECSLHEVPGGKIYHGRVGVPEEENEGGAGGATAGEQVLVTSLLGILYAADAGVVSQ